MDHLKTPAANEKHFLISNKMTSLSSVLTIWTLTELLFVWLGVCVFDSEQLDLEKMLVFACLCYGNFLLVYCSGPLFKYFVVQLQRN